MKNILILLLATSLFSCTKDKILTEEDYPSEVKSYVQNHFEDYEILQVIKDRDGLTRTYDVSLEENISLEFNRQKEIIKLESPYKLPNSVIPSKILTYVNTNYSSNFIVKWELDNNNQEVELDNDLTLIFDKDSNFKRIED